MVTSSLDLLYKELKSVLKVVFVVFSLIAIKVLHWLLLVNKVLYPLTFIPSANDAMSESSPYTADVVREVCL